MIKALALFAILCGVLFVYGGSAGGDRMRVSYVEQERPRKFTLIVSVPDITIAYATLVVTSCAALITENGVLCLDDARTTYSEQSFRHDKKAYEFPFPPPRGTVQFQAIALAQNKRVLASDRLTLMRGF